MPTGAVHAATILPAITTFLSVTTAPVSIMPAPRLEREAGRQPWGAEAGEEPERDFRMQYAWELCLCETGRTA